MLDFLGFHVASFVLVVFGAGLLALYGLGVGKALDRIWPSRGMRVRDFEVVGPLVIAALVLLFVF